MTFNHPYFQTTLGYAVNADCFEIMSSLADNSVDMVLCDLPYGITDNKWDCCLDLEMLWKEYHRICKGAIVLTAAQPFTSILIASNFKYFKYDWIWQKEMGTNFLNSKIQPLRVHENICVFYKKQPVYNPQWTYDKPYTMKQRGGSANYNKQFNGAETVSDGRRYPKTVLQFPRDKQKIHPTQKPVALFEYMISTYTNVGDFVLDNCAGSCTTGVAAENLGRRWLCVERDSEYFEKSKGRFSIEKVD